MSDGTVRPLRRGGDPEAEARIVFARELVGAIRDRRVVRVARAGEGDGVRTLRPHVLYDGPTGERYVEGMQTAGPSSGPLPAWRCFTLTEVESLDVLGTTFRPSSVFNPRDDRYRGGAIAMVEPSRGERTRGERVPFAAGGGHT